MFNSIRHHHTSSQTTQAAQRRRLLLVAWQERFNRLAGTPVRSDTERLAKHQALALMESARPDAEKQVIAGHG